MESLSSTWSWPWVSFTTAAASPFGNTSAPYSKVKDDWEGSYGSSADVHDRRLAGRRKMAAVSKVNKKGKEARDSAQYPVLSL